MFWILRGVLTGGAGSLFLQMLIGVSRLQFLTTTLMVQPSERVTNCKRCHMTTASHQNPVQGNSMSGELPKKNESNDSRQVNKIDYSLLITGHYVMNRMKFNVRYRYRSRHVSSQPLHLI